MQIKLFFSFYLFLSLCPFLLAMEGGAGSPIPGQGQTKEDLALDLGICHAELAAAKRELEILKRECLKTRASLEKRERELTEINKAMRKFFEAGGPLAQENPLSPEAPEDTLRMIRWAFTATGDNKALVTSLWGSVNRFGRPGPASKLVVDPKERAAIERLLALSLKK